MKRNEFSALLATALSFAFLAGACGLERHGLKEGDSISCNITKKLYSFSHSGNDWIFEGTCTREEGAPEGSLSGVSHTLNYEVKATWDRQTMIWKERVQVSGAENSTWLLQGSAILDPWLYYKLAASVSVASGDPQALAAALGLTSFPMDLWHVPFSRNVVIHGMDGSTLAALRAEEQAELAKPPPPPPVSTCPEEILKAEPDVILPEPKSVFSGETPTVIVAMKTDCVLAAEEYEKSYYVAIVERMNGEGGWDFFARAELPARQGVGGWQATLGSGELPVGGPGFWRVRGQQSFETEAHGRTAGETSAGNTFLVGEPIDLSEIDIPLAERAPGYEQRSLEGMEDRFGKLEMKNVDSLPGMKGQVALAAVPDLLPRTFESAALLPGEESPGGATVEEKTYYFGWTVWNKGAADAPASKLFVECTSHGVGKCPPEADIVFDIPALAAGKEHVLMWYFPAPDGKVMFQFRATADPYDEITEGTDNNNVLSSAFSSANSPLSAAMMKERGRAVAAQEGQDGLKPIFGAKTMEKTGKTPEAAAMKKGPSPAMKASALSERSGAGAAALSRDRLARVKMKPTLTFETIDWQPADPKSGKPFDLMIDVTNSGTGPCQPDQEYMLNCSALKGGPCPFESGNRKIGKTIPAGGHASLKIHNLTAGAGTYGIQAGPVATVGGSFANATLTVDIYYIPPPSDKAVKKKQGIDPEDIPKAMQKKETEEEKPKVPLQKQKY